MGQVQPWSHPLFHPRVLGASGEVLGSARQPGGFRAHQAQQKATWGLEHTLHAPQGPSTLISTRTTDGPACPSLCPQVWR